MPLTSEDVLQEAATIEKTTQTIMGDVIPCSGADRITLFFDYVKGDETGLLIVPSIIYGSLTGQAYQDQDWSAAAGTRTVTANEYKVTATGNHMIMLDVSAADFVKFTQGGSDNDGTPTGTVAATYALSSF